MKQLYTLVLCLLLLIPFSCKQNTNSNSGNQPETENNNSIINDSLPETGAQPKFKDTKVESAEVRTEPGNNEVFVVVSGKFSKPCEHIGEIKQSREGKNITITLTTILPPGNKCPDLEVPMNHTIPIDTKGFEPDTYTVSVNGQKTTFVKK